MGEERLAPPLDRLSMMPQVHRRLRASMTVGALFAQVAELAREVGGYERAVVLSVGDGVLTADTTDVLDDPASDALRRRVRSHSVTVAPGTEEAELIRRLGTSDASLPTAVGDTLELEHHAFGLIAPESRALALIVADRISPPVDKVDRAMMAAFSTVVASVLERTVLRARLRELSREWRYLTRSAEAFLGEVIDAPVSLPSGAAGELGFPHAGALEPASDSNIRELLTARELEIARLLVDGRSNREIAEALILSPETVKGHVGRIFRKLGASNRVEAVSRYLRLSRVSSPPE